MCNLCFVSVHVPLTFEIEFFFCLLPPPAQPILYWCSRNMSFWSSISFNLAVLMNLLVAFFYPLEGVRGGETRIFTVCHEVLYKCNLYFFSYNEYKYKHIKI